MNDAAAKVYERVLILRCQTGDEAALQELIERYSPGLLYFLRKLVGPRGHADGGGEDLLQETWFEVYRKINRLEQAEAFPAWVYRIARDKAYRALRRRPMARMPTDADLAEAPAGGEDPCTPEEKEQVRTALDRLPSEQREVLVLRFIEEMSYEQIAQVIARPIGTVRSRIYYAKLAMRAKLE